MAPKPWERLRDRKKRREQEAGEAVALDTDEHAWWAACDNLERTYEPPPPKETKPPEPGHSMFEEYFSTESLFTYGDPPRTDADDGSVPHSEWDRPDPYVVLGLPESATWEQITTADRRLAKLHHPDRLLNATHEDRDRSERRMRELNIAYSELRRRRGR